MNDKSTVHTPDIANNLAEKKLKEALKALELVKILGDAKWKSERAAQAIFEIERITK